MKGGGGWYGLIYFFFLVPIWNSMSFLIIIIINRQLSNRSTRARLDGVVGLDTPPPTLYTVNIKYL